MQANQNIHSFIFEENEIENKQRTTCMEGVSSCTLPRKCHSSTSCKAWSMFGQAILFSFRDILSVVLTFSGQKTPNLHMEICIPSVTNVSIHTTH